MQDMQEGAYPKKWRQSVAGQFAAVKYRSEMYCWTQKLNREGYGVDKYCILFFFERGHRRAHRYSNRGHDRLL